MPEERSFEIGQKETCSTLWLEHFCRFGEWHSFCERQPGEG